MILMQYFVDGQFSGKSAYTFSSIKRWNLSEKDD